MAIGYPPSPRDGVISDMGRRVLDLRDRGWTSEKIASRIGCHKSQVVRLVTDPRSSPRYRTGESLIELHAYALSGKTQWGLMVMALQAAGLSRDIIARRCGIHSGYLKELIKNPLIRPAHGTAARLIRMYESHCKE